MYSYSFSQWILFFFCYSFLGWIWECFYVSAVRMKKNKKLEFVNRGFLHGPMIPIYGFAAIAILLTTISHREHAVVIYCVGAITATVFELVTGSVMERLFKVKYWDYSDLPLNYKGYICFFVSLVWGFFAVILVRVIHVPIEGVMVKVPRMVCEGIAFVIAIIFAHDATVSFREAMDLREILESLSENNETIRRMEQRFDALVGFNPIPNRDEIRYIRWSVKENLLYDIEKLRWKNEERINRIKEYIQLPEFDNLPDRKELLESLEASRRRLVGKNSKLFVHAMNQLKRNPKAKSEKYQETLDLLKDLLKKQD